jgi:hypothetical protein
VPPHAEPGERMEPVGQGQQREDERDDRGQQHAEDGVGDEEDGEDEGEAEPSASVEDRRCHGNETAHGATVAPRHPRMRH